MQKNGSNLVLALVGLAVLFVFVAGMAIIVITSSNQDNNLPERQTADLGIHTPALEVIGVDEYYEGKALLALVNALQPLLKQISKAINRPPWIAVIVMCLGSSFIGFVFGVAWTSKPQKMVR